MKKLSNKLVRIFFFLVVLLSSTTLLKAQDPGGPLDPNDTSLPVKLINLTFERKLQQINLSWNTVGEYDLASYAVEKSIDGKIFTTRYTVSAKNTATASYSFIDEARGAAYYRIRANDKNGSKSYSAIKFVTSDVKVAFNVYPNPLVGKTLFVTTGTPSTTKYTVFIYNAAGKKVYNASLNGSTEVNNLKVGNLAAGIYKVVISTESGIVNTKTLEVLNN